MPNDGLVATDKALLRFSKAVSATEKKKYVFQVQYNPSSVRLSTRAGSYQQTNFGKQGMNKFGQYNSPPTTSLDVSLIFDDMFVDDAFMLTRVNNLSAGRIVQNAVDKKTYTDKRSKYGHTIQPQVEGLLSLLTAAEHNLVEFCWADMKFKGIITHIEAKYTMFNQLGHPVRAVVQLSIQQAVLAETDNDTESEKAHRAEIVNYWDDAFSKVFGDKSNLETVDVEAFDVKTALQNFINL